MRALYCLLGDPVAHSRSPAIHARAFALLGVDAVYAPCKVAAAELPLAVAGLMALGAAGFNITVPHKEPAALLVDKIQLQRINANRNKTILDTNDVVQNAALQTIVPGGPCAPFQFQREYGTVSNPIQLLPGSYQVTVQATVGKRRLSKTVGFAVDTCGFNSNIVIDF